MTDSEIVAAEIRAAEVPMSDALGAALDRLERDAERYRWLRDEARDWEDAKIINLYAGPDFERATGEELDAIIDIEMAPKRYVLGAA